MREPGQYRDRALAPTTTPDEMRELAGCPYPFVWQALATRPDVPADVLEALMHRSDTDWNNNRLLALIARHEQANRPVLLSVLEHVQRLLAMGERPYAAGLALASRAELTVDEASGMLTRPGGSRRFRVGLRARLSERAASTNERPIRTAPLSGDEETASPFRVS
ncbi:hypothetical protein [Promicromonospora sp. NPDC057488]|uniref:hypothetical protein n=1 Tax=Promicromonospora sp. NPDC057488 TaxID=3346147 RepID=UPI0036727658